MATHSFAFDTLHYYERLKSAGVPDAQAKIQAETQGDLVKEIVDTQLVTKADIAELRNDIKTLKIELQNDNKIIRSEIDTKIKTLENALLIKLGGMMAVSLGVILAAIKLIH